MLLVDLMMPGVRSIDLERQVSGDLVAGSPGGLLSGATWGERHEALARIKGVWGWFRERSGLREEPLEDGSWCKYDADQQCACVMTSAI